MSSRCECVGWCEGVSCDDLCKDHNSGQTTFKHLKQQWVTENEHIFSSEHEQRKWFSIRHLQALCFDCLWLKCDLEACVCSYTCGVRGFERAIGWQRLCVHSSAPGAIITPLYCCQTDVCFRTGNKVFKTHKFKNTSGKVTDHSYINDFIH